MGAACSAGVTRRSHLAKCFALKPSISISGDRKDIEISTFVIYRAKDIQIRRGYTEAIQSKDIYTLHRIII